LIAQAVEGIRSRTGSHISVISRKSPTNMAGVEPGGEKKT